MDDPSQRRAEVVNRLLESRERKMALADSMWSEILRSHPTHRVIGTRGPLPSFDEPGCVYVRIGTRPEIVVIVAESLVVARHEFLTWEFAPRRESIIWVSGSVEAIRTSSPVLSRAKSPLGKGRPVLIRTESDWRKAPAVAGIYRIHIGTQDGRGLVYIGRSRDLSRRPRIHEKTRNLPWGVPGGVTRIELIAVKATQSGSLWTITDLDDAEAEHIARARDREATGGPRVLNVTTGRNGRPSAPGTHLYVWQPSVSAEDEITESDPFRSE